MDLHESQVALERDMITHGVDTYRRTQENLKAKGRNSETAPGRRLVVEAVNQTSEAIAAFIEKATAGGSGRRHTAVKYLQGEDTSTLGYLTAKAIIDAAAAARPVPIQGLARTISTMIQDEQSWRHFEQTHPGYCRAIKRGLRERTRSAKQSHDALTHATNRLEVAIERWPMAKAVQVGVKLIELFAESTGIIEIAPDMRTTQKKGARSAMYVVKATQQTLDWIRGMDEYAELLTPFFTPCVIPPKDWTTPTDGGYHGPMAGRLKLVKTFNKGYLEALEGVDMPVVYEAVNALQRTAWQVHGGILKVMRQAVSEHLQIGNLPTGDLQDLPPKPHGFDEDPEISKAWRLVARDTYAHNRRTGTKTIQLSRIVAVAERYEDYPEIFFPYTLDFRGRAYPVTGMLHPQGADVAKGLLRFGEGKRIGEQGAAWLAIHLANVAGYDKASLQERIDWVVSEEGNILRSAMEPLDHDWWSQSDNPWQTLAACMEWAGFRLQGEDYITHLPIAMDGSCNGLQHYSAMLLDEVGGKAVNLVPQDTPADIYHEVLLHTLEGLKVEALGEGEDALQKDLDKFMEDAMGAPAGPPVWVPTSH